MKPPSNLALSVSRDRASAARGFSRFVRHAGPTVPGFSSTAALKRFKAPAAAVRPPVDTRVSFADRLRLERAGLGEAAIRESVRRAAAGDRSPKPSYAETIRAGRTGAAKAGAVPKATIDRMRDDTARAAGEDAPAPKLSVADRERLARRYAAEHGCSIEVARLAVAGGAR